MSVESHVDKWHRQLFRTDAIERPRAEELLRPLYRAAGLPEPEHFLWFDSPLAAIWPLAVVLGDSEPYTQPLLKNVRRAPGGKDRLAETEKWLAERLRIGRDKVAGFLGRPLYTFSGQSAMNMRLTTERMDLILARAGAGAAWQAGAPGPFGVIDTAEELLFGYRQPEGLYTAAADRAGAKEISVLLLRSAQHRLYVDRSFGEIARDEAIAEREAIEVSPLVRAFWSAAEATGLWWPLERGVVLAERPASVEGAGDGLRMEWTDGFVVGATRPGSKPERPAPAKGTATAASEPASVLSMELPRDHEARIAFLRKQSPNLPLFERYLAGEHEQVWNELVALGPRALTESHAADALAVAYETMVRVAQNVQLLAERLNALGYRFVQPGSTGGLLGGLFGRRDPARHEPHVPPKADAPNRIAELEKAAEGPIPLSLRAFFDVVGEVNFMGEHPTLAPADSPAAPDPLVVCGVDEAIGCVESCDDEDRFIAIAPDALHKANTSGGDPYMIFVPAPAADSPLEEEPHEVDFVSYLRIAIGCGGFPGWQDSGHVPPAELEQLRKGLIPF